MSGKALFRVKMLLYSALLLLALLMDSAAFGALNLRYRPYVLPMAVACIGLWEGTEKGAIFGLIAGCVWAWSGALTMYGAWRILTLTLVGLGAGLLSQRFLLRSWKTILGVSAAALFLTEGIYVILLSVSGTLPSEAIMTKFLPECLISLPFCLIFYPLSRCISRIGGFHG